MQAPTDPIYLSILSFVCVAVALGMSYWMFRNR